MKLLFTGDLVINQSYNPSSQIESDLKDMFLSSDFNIVNLECPITNSESKIVKTGPYLKGNESSTFNVMQYLNINIAALANNHIKDYGEKGVIDTINFCNKNQIKAVGAGKNLIDAAQTATLNNSESNSNIALINIAENEWASAGEDSAGANGLNLIKDTKKIQEAKAQNSIVIVVVHGGHEYYNLPSPRIRELFRFYIEQGADLVVSHHTHCISGFEVYKGKPIYYGLGNFLFTKHSTFDDWYVGLVLEVNIDGSDIKTYLHPISQNPENFNLKLLKGEEKNQIINRVRRYSKVITDDSNLRNTWNQFIELKGASYINYWSPLSFIKNRYIASILRKLKLNMINKKGLTLYLNLMRCESHHDVSKEIIKRHIDK